MAPFIEATIQLLLGSVRTGIQPHKSVEQNLACHHAHDKEVHAPTAKGPSLSAISWGFNRMDVFGEDLESGNIDHKYWDGYQWGPSVQALEDLGAGNGQGGPPAAVSRNASLMDIFRVNSGKVLEHKYYDGSAWKPSETDWEVLVDYALLDLTAAPATCSWDPTRLDVFAKVYSSDCLLHTYYDGTTWKPGEDDDLDVFCGVNSGAAAVSWGPNRIDVFAVTSDLSLAHLYWDGSQWSDWEGLIGDIMPETPAAVTWGSNRFDVFAINVNGNLTHVYWDGSQYKNEDLGSGDEATFVGTVSVTTWGEGRFDIVALGEDGQYYYKYYGGGNWSPWYPKGYPADGLFISSPASVSWGENRLDIWGVTDSNKLGHQTYYGSGWYPGPSAWETLGGLLESFGPLTAKGKRGH